MPPKLKIIVREPPLGSAPLSPVDAVEEERKHAPVAVVVEKKSRKRRARRAEEEEEVEASETERAEPAPDIDTMDDTNKTEQTAAATAFLTAATRASDANGTMKEQREQLKAILRDAADNVIKMPGKEIRLIKKVKPKAWNDANLKIAIAAAWPQLDAQAVEAAIVSFNATRATFASVTEEVKVFKVANK